MLAYQPKLIFCFFPSAANLPMFLLKVANSNQSFEKQFTPSKQGRKSRGGCIPPIIFEGGCGGDATPPIIPPNNLSYAAIFDDLSCGFNGLPFLANMVTDCYSLFLFTHSINKVQTLIVRIAEKKIKLCFL